MFAANFAAKVDDVLRQRHHCCQRTCVGLGRLGGGFGRVLLVCPTQAQSHPEHFHRIASTLATVSTLGEVVRNSIAAIEFYTVIPTEKCAVLFCSAPIFGD